MGKPQISRREGILNQTVRIELGIALERGEFRLEYQPRVDLQVGRVIGLEALVRWEHPDRGTMLPREFILAAEESGLIKPLGDWVLRTACAQNKAWQELGLPRVLVAVNVSPSQLDQRFVRKVKDAVAETGLEAKYLQLELTEHVWPSDLKRAEEILAELIEIDVQIAVDNFGTGYASLAYLRHIPAQVINIDRRWMQDVTGDPTTAEFINSVVSLARAFDKKILAEGVETAEQLAILRANGCDQMQGFLFSRPLPPDGVAELLRQGRRLH